MDKIFKDLQKDLGKALNGLNKTLANLPEEARMKMPNALSDVNRIKSALKNADSSIIEEISKKYARINNE